MKMFDLDQTWEAIFKNAMLREVAQRSNMLFQHDFLIFFFFLIV